MNAEKVATGLGIFSIVLGLAEIFAAKDLGRMLGTEERSGTIRGFGAREMGAGLGILAGRGKRAPWLWGRVSGDALDLATLGSIYTPENPKKNTVGIALIVVAAITVLDVWCARELHRLKG